MPDPAFSQTVRRLVRPPATDPDQTLLDRWASAGDHAAFELLVWRYRGLVLGTCGRFPSPADADDAFQATFLVLARKAGSAARRGSLGGWLHRVAIRAALRLRGKGDRQPTTLLADPPAPPAGVSPAETADLRAVMDEELNRLPDKFRRVLVLCHLEGKSAAAAEELGCARGTVLSRLHRGRERLRVRLVRRSLAPAALLVAGPAIASVPGRLVDTTLTLVTGGAGAGCAAAGLARGVLNAMWMRTVKLYAAIGLTVAGLALGLGAGWQSAGAQSAPTAQAKAEPPPQAEPPKAAGPVAPKAAGPAAAQGAAGPVRVFGPAAKKEVSAKAGGKLEGEWEVASLELGGETVPEDTAKALGFTFGADKVTLKGTLAEGGGTFIVRPSSEEFPFKIDTAKDPATIDIEVKPGEFAKGIYKLDGNDLTLCIDWSRADRPAKFESKDQPAVGLMKLKRATK